MASVLTVLLLISIPSIVTAQLARPCSFRCDYKYTAGEGWFKVYTTPVTWSQANFICNMERAQLATYTTRGILEHNALLSLMRAHNVTTVQFGSRLAEENLVLATTEKDTFTILFKKASEFEEHPYICYAQSPTVVDLNECGTTDDEYKLNKKTDECYKFHRHSMTWRQADWTCYIEGGALAVINSETEAQAIDELFTNNPAEVIPGPPDWKDVAFIGFSKSMDGWFTVHNQSLAEAGYDTWAPGEPNNARGDEICGAVGRDGGLIDKPCTRKHIFICEKSRHNEYKLSKKTGKYYKFHRRRTTWRLAARTCQYEGGDLAVINSETEAQAIEEMFTNNPAEVIPGPPDWKNVAFIGFSKSMDGWFTVDNQSLAEAGYNTWAPGEPNNLRGYDICGAVGRDGGLIDERCISKHIFICEKRRHTEYKLNNKTGKCYKFHRLRKNWRQAARTCQIEGGALAVINNEAEAQAINEVFTNNPAEVIAGPMDWRDMAFIGFSKSIDGWFTVDNQSLAEAGYDTWAPGEPNNARGDEYCGAVGRDGGLIDDPCTRELPFICEKKKDIDCDVEGSTSSPNIVRTV